MKLPHLFYFFLGSPLFFLYGAFLLEQVYPFRANLDTLRLRRWLTNFSFAFIIVALSSLVFLSPFTVAKFAQTQKMGIFNVYQVPIFWVLIVSFLVRSFVGGWLPHFLAHKIPLVWRAHQVHHADYLLDASSAFRSHPFDVLFRMFFVCLPPILLGIPPWIVGLYEAIEAFVNIINHANLRMPARLELILSKVIITPCAHYFHHSKDVVQGECNYETLFSFWDRLFKFYRGPDTKLMLASEVGLKEVGPVEASSLWQQLLLPFKKPRG